MSSLGWLDTDEQQRSAMLEFLHQFVEEGVRDELGLESIARTLGEQLFPGVLYRHTRARYLLFVPWIYRSVVEEGYDGDTAVRMARRREVQLIYALEAGGERQGVIGISSRENLQSMPSELYWSATSEYGIRGLPGVSAYAYLQQARSLRERMQEEKAWRYEESRSEANPVGTFGWHHHLPPRPRNLLRETSFELSTDEGNYLAERIATGVRGSLLSWLVTAGRPTTVASIWQHPQLAEFPDGPGESGDIVDHARRFAIVIAGARLLHNLMVVQLQIADGTDRKAEEAALRLLREWQSLMHTEKVLSGWDQGRFWDVVARTSVIHARTQDFVNDWVRFAERGSQVAEDPGARDLVKRREWSLKKAQGSLSNKRTRAGHIPPDRIWLNDFRWTPARRLLADLYQASSGPEGAEDPDART